MNLRQTILVGARLALGIALAGMTTPGMANPPDSASTSLEDYMAMDKKIQNEFIFNTQQSVFNKLKGINSERAICIAELFTNNEKGINRFNAVKGTLEDAASKKMKQSSEELTELVLFHFCPIGSPE
jgi:hypothetical protein